MLAILDVRPVASTHLRLVPDMPMASARLVAVVSPSLRPMVGSATDVHDDLARRFRDGDRDAVRDVYARYGGAVHAVTRRALSDAGLAEEAMQQTFLQAWRSASSVDPDRDLGPWLYTIARRVAIDLYRRESRRAAVSYDAAPDGAPLDPALVSMPPSIETAWDIWQVRQAIDAMSPDDQDVIRLQHFDGLTQGEIAERLGLPIGTVKSRTFRAHRRLAAALGHLAEVDG